MGQNIYDIDTVGFNDLTLGEYFDFHINNNFYMLAPEYYYQLYAIYLSRCINLYDGWVNGWHNKQSGLIPQYFLASIANGLTNILFGNGIDFIADGEDYKFATEWAERTKFARVLSQAYTYAVAGGTSMLKLNRKGKELFVTAHRIDTWFADFGATGDPISVRCYYSMIDNANGQGEKFHYGICEERYFNNEGKPVSVMGVYRCSDLTSGVNDRPKNAVTQVKWENLPQSIKNYIKDNYPQIMIGRETYLPFVHSLGCHFLRFTNSIPKCIGLPLGRPIGDILTTESFQFDQMKYFEKNEVDLARARALLPEEMWNNDDPDHRALQENFYQKVSTTGDDSDKVTPIQFALRGMDIKAQKENIYKDAAFKLNISASTLASFLSEGAGAKTATEIIGERTKTDTWIKSQITLNAPDINDLLREVLLYNDKNPAKVIIRAENQAPFLETLKTNSDVFGAGNMSPELFVKLSYQNLTTEERKREIELLKEKQAMQKQNQLAMQNSWQK